MERCRYEPRWCPNCQHVWHELTQPCIYAEQEEEEYSCLYCAGPKKTLQKQCPSSTKEQECQTCVEDTQSSISQGETFMQPITSALQATAITATAPGVWSFNVGGLSGQLDDQLSRFRSFAVPASQTPSTMLESSSGPQRQGPPILPTNMTSPNRSNQFHNSPVARMPEEHSQITTQPTTSFPTASSQVHKVEKGLLGAGTQGQSPSTGNTASTHGTVPPGAQPSTTEPSIGSQPRRLAIGPSGHRHIPPNDWMDTSLKPRECLNDGQLVWKARYLSLKGRPDWRFHWPLSYETPGAYMARQREIERDEDDSILIAEYCGWRNNVHNEPILPRDTAWTRWRERTHSNIRPDLRSLPGAWIRGDHWQFRQSPDSNYLPWKPLDINYTPVQLPAVSHEPPDWQTWRQAPPETFQFDKRWRRDKYNAALTARPNWKRPLPYESWDQFFYRQTKGTAPELDRVIYLRRVYVANEETDPAFATAHGAANLRKRKERGSDETSPRESHSAVNPGSKGKQYL